MVLVLGSNESHVEWKRCGTWDKRMRTWSMGKRTRLYQIDKLFIWIEAKGDGVYGKSDYQMRSYGTKEREEKF